MDAVEFIKGYLKMCDSYNSCMHCPSHKERKEKGYEISCSKFKAEHPEDFVKIVEEWWKENKPITNAEHVANVVEKLGYHTDIEQIRNACPPHRSEYFVEGYCNHWGCDRECDECHKWWDEEYKEDGNGED